MEYDRNGKLASTTITDPERKFTEKPDGSFKSEQFHPDGTPKSTVEGRADQTSRVTEYSENSTKITERDKHGNAIQKREERIDGSYSQENFDSVGNVRKLTEGRADGSRTETEFNGNESTSKDYDRDGKLAGTTIADPERRFTEKPDGSFKSEQFHPDGTPKNTVEGRADQTSRVTEYSENSTKITERDKDGNAIQMREERIDGSYRQENYDPDGSVKKLAEGRPDGSRSETTVSDAGIEKSEFDQSGNLVQQRQDNLDGSYNQQNYNQDGSMRSSVSGNADGSRTETSYSAGSTETSKFDRAGNAVFHRVEKSDGSYNEQNLNPDGSTTHTEGSSEGRTETRIGQAGTETTRYDSGGNLIYSGQKNSDGSGTEQKLNPDGSVTLRHTQSNGDARETTTHGNDVISRTETSTPEGRVTKTELPEGKTILEEKNKNGDVNLKVTDNKSGDTIYSSQEKADGSYKREFTDEHGSRHKINGAADGSRVEEQVSDLGVETTAYDSNGNVTFNQKVNPDGSGYQQIQNADGSVTVNLKESNGKIDTTTINPDRSALEAQDKGKAAAEAQDARIEAQKTLFNPEASAEAKLLAARDLAHSGMSTLHGEDGKTYRINTDNYGKREGVIVTVAGIPALRGIVDNSTNEVSRQKNSRGQELDYAGSAASQKFKNDPVVNYKREPEPDPKPKPLLAPEQAKPVPSPVPPANPPRPGQDNVPLPPPKPEQREPSAPEHTAKTVTSDYKAKATGYYPANTRMQGGTKDRIGNSLKGHTLEDYMAKRAAGKVGPDDYVAIAMDDGKKHKGYPNSGTQPAPKYGDMVRIPELNAKYGGDIPFKVVDTGGRFYGKGFSKVDICRADKSKAYDPAIQGNLTLQFYKKKAN